IARSTRRASTSSRSSAASWRRPNPSACRTPSPARDHGMNGPAQALFLRRLAATRDGRLEVRLPDGTSRVFGDPHSDLRAVVEIRDPGVFRRFVFGGDVAFGETYAEGRWTSPDLPSVVRLGVR